jgi:hypothetical protein
MRATRRPQRSARSSSVATWGALLTLTLTLGGCAGASQVQVQDSLNKCNEDYRALNIEHQNINKALQGRAAALSLRPPHGDASPAVITDALDSSELEGLLKNFGFSFDLIKTDAYMFTLSNTRVILFNKGTSLQLYAGFHAKPSLIKVNEWNQMTRFSRAYLDQEGDAIIEFDLDLESGWTREGIQEFIRTFGLVVEAYRMFLSSPDEQRRTVSL